MNPAAHLVALTTEEVKELLNLADRRIVAFSDDAERYPEDKYLQECAQFWQGVRRKLNAALA